MSPDGETIALGINTFPDWDGTSYLLPFGHPDTSTYGQVVTAPAGRADLRRFKFKMAPIVGEGTMIMRGVVATWDGSKAGQVLWESAPLAVPLNGGYRNVVFRVVPKVRLQAGQRYVLFASVSKDYEDTPENFTSQWATIYEDVYAGGDVVYLNDAGDEGKWTTESWSGITGWDFGIRVWLTR